MFKEIPCTPHPPIGNVGKVIPRTRSTVVAPCTDGVVVVVFVIAPDFRNAGNCAISVHISYTEDRRLRLDFIEGNYTGTDRKPQLTWSQRAFVRAAKKGLADVHVWHHYNDGKRWRWERLA